MSGQARARPELAVGAVLTDAQGRVLLIQRGHAPSAGRWTLPGGRVEGGETIAQALHRELLAETGLSARLGDLAKLFEYIDEKYHFVILDYRMTEPRGELRAGDDAADARFFTLAEAASLLTTDGLMPILHEILGGTPAA